MNKQREDVNQTTTRVLNTTLARFNF